MNRPWQVTRNQPKDPPRTWREDGTQVKLHAVDLTSRHCHHLTYEMAIGFMLFAALATRKENLLSRAVPSSLDA